MSYTKLKKYIVTSISIFILTGCVAAEPEIALELDLPQEFSFSGDQELEEKWWMVYQDEDLNSMMEDALSSNLSLRATWERLSQAEAILKSRGASLYPDLTFDGGAQSAESNFQNGMQDSYSAGLSSSYELDFWGRISSNIQAASLEYNSSKENLRTAAVTLSSEVVTTWYDLQAQHQQIRLLQKQSELNTQHLLLTEITFRSGQANASDVLQQRQALEAVRAEAILAQNQIEIFEHQLAVLVGKAPSELKYKIHAEIPYIEDTPMTGIPSEILMQRPDVKEAYFQFLASDKDLAVAVAEQYPRFSISATYDKNTKHGSEIFNNWLLTLAANVSAPIFDGGLRKSEVQRVQAIKNEKFYLYMEKVLQALQEIEDALSSIHYQKAYVQSLEKQLKFSKLSETQIREQYLHGNTEFISFLNAQLSYQGLERNHVTANADLIETSISLYRSLSTGWKMKKNTIINKGTNEK